MQHSSPGPAVPPLLALFLLLLSPAAVVDAWAPSQRQSVGLWPIPQWVETNGTDPTLFLDAASFAFRPDNGTCLLYTSPSPRDRG